MCFLHTLYEVGVDLVDDAQGNPSARLAIPGAIGADRAVFCAREIEPHIRHELANGLAAGARGVLDLVKKAPEDHLQGKDAFAAVLAGGGGGEQGGRKIAAKDPAKLSKGAELGEVGEGVF